MIVDIAKHWEDCYDEEQRYADRRPRPRAWDT
jgi:hypothetical protein